MSDLLMSEGDAALRTLRAALNTGDLATMIHVAHSLRGSSTTLGAHTVAQICAALERQARDGVIAEDIQLLHLEQELQRVRDALNRFAIAASR
jgi:HPt (histidine-containing phosphotransfer) domain-containing protein